MLRVLPWHYSETCAFRTPWDQPKVSWLSRCPDFPGQFTCKWVLWDHYQVSWLWRCPYFQVSWLTVNSWSLLCKLAFGKQTQTFTDHYIMIHNSRTLAHVALQSMPSILPWNFVTDKQCMESWDKTTIRMKEEQRKIELWNASHCWSRFHN